MGVTQRKEHAQEVINRIWAEKKVDAIMIDDTSPVKNKDQYIVLKW